MIIRKRIQVYGRVQGVGFRWYASMMASRLNVTGWAHNEYDGSVTLEVQGNEADVRDFTNAVTSGPRYAEVEDFSIQTRDVIEERSFRVI